MSNMHTVTRAFRYRDAEGNTYAVERSVKTGRWIVARLNPSAGCACANQAKNRLSAEA